MKKMRMIWWWWWCWWWWWRWWICPGCCSSPHTKRCCLATGIIGAFILLVGLVLMVAGRWCPFHYHLFVFCLCICICFSCWTRPDDVLFTSILYQLVELSERHFRSFKFIDVSTKYCRGLLEGMILKSMALKEGSGRFKTNKKSSKPKYWLPVYKLIELVIDAYYYNPGQPHGSHLNSWTSRLI